MMSVTLFVVVYVCGLYLDHWLFGGINARHK